MATTTRVDVGGHEVTLSNLDKVIYPKTHFTKADVLQYYAAVAATILPHLKERPLTLKRYPHGVDGDFFYEKQCPAHRPDWFGITRVSRKSHEGSIHYCVIQDTASLIWVANLGSIEMHTLLSKASNTSRPTMMAFDLDPGEGVLMKEVAAIALELRRLFQTLHLASFAKTSGQKGLHVYVPLNTPVTFDETKAFAKALANAMESLWPGRIVSEMSKALRKGRVFIDWSQNDEHKTTCTAYSLRATPIPLVSTPLAWDEVESAAHSKSSKGLQFGPDEVIERVKRLGDLFEPALWLKQRLPTLADLAKPRK